MGSELVFICISAFAAVFVLLAVLAAIQRLIIIIFPYKEPAIDATVLAAISSVASSVYPGTKVTNIKEIK